MNLETRLRADRKFIWVFSCFWFLGLELLLKLKLGVVFWLSFGWFLALDWESWRLLGAGFSKNLSDRIVKSLYYGFLVTLFIFIFFSLFNLLLRTLDNSWRFFQLS